MTTIYEKLDLNFDTDKFGDVNLLDEKTIRYYTEFPNTLKDWQYNDITGAPLSRTDYFRNPVVNVSSELRVTVNSMIQIANGVSYANSPATGNLIYTTAVATLPEIDAFISHTNNVSGVSAQSMSSPDIPSYDLALSVGNEILRIVVSEEEILNASPFLGNFTSLFIEEDLQVINDVIVINVSELANSITVSTYEDPPSSGEYYTVYLSNLSSSRINVIYSNISTAYNLVYGRRTEDWQFYQRSRQVLNDYMMLNRFNSIGNTQRTLISDYIGTDRLKNNLANT
jgi:hypothetical protein